MNTKQLQLVTYEQAKRLKAVGFDLETCLFYSPGGVIRAAYDTPRNCNEDECELSCPAVALALKWIRDEKGIPNAVEYNTLNHYSVYKGVLFFGRQLEFEWTGGYETYEAAESALLDELLTIL